MIGKIFITRTGYDPQMGKHVKDPFLGPHPTLGACRPDIRKQLNKGDQIFVISGKIPDFNQFVMGGFEIEAKIPALEAYRLFPELRLRRLEDGQLTGNIIVTADGRQHELDTHSSFQRRIQNYVVGTNPISLVTSAEIAEGRKQTLAALRDILHKKGKSPYEVVGHFGTGLTEKQVLQLRDWLEAIKRAAKNQPRTPQRFFAIWPVTSKEYQCCGLKEITPEHRPTARLSLSANAGMEEPVDTGGGGQPTEDSAH